MSNYSEFTIKEIWPKLKELGVAELRINNGTVWSDSILDVMHDYPNYPTLVNDYLLKAEEELLSAWYADFRVTSIQIDIIDGHHCIAQLYGYYIEED